MQPRFSIFLTLLWQGRHITWIGGLYPLQPPRNRISWLPDRTLSAEVHTLSDLGDCVIRVLFSRLAAFVLNKI